MKIKSTIKRLTIYSSMITLLFVLNSSSNRKRNKDFFRNTTKIYNRKIEYNSGTIYIGNEYYLKSVKRSKMFNDDDILVLDSRRAKDPNVQIYDSYKINNGEVMEEIVEALLLYEERYPTKWERSKNSMIREWTAHNMMFKLGYDLERTSSVDLNNDDEKVYQIRNYIQPTSAKERR